MKLFLVRLLAFFVMLVLGACTTIISAPDGQLRVVATTSVVGDVLGAVGGDLIQVTVLLPPGADPHDYQPSPQEIAAVAEADLVFLNGLGLEIFMERLIENAGGDVTVVSVSDGVSPILSRGGEYQPAPDPHVWMDPGNVQIWVDNIAEALSNLDPDNAATYWVNAESYKSELLELDEWAKTLVAELPLQRRVLITDHDALGYFAAHYDFDLIGAIIPNFSTLSEPSAAEIAEIQALIQRFDVPAIFVDSSVNPALSAQIAADTGIQLVTIYSASLTAESGPASTYLAMMRYSIHTIVDALRE